jgi:hypothetical protein
LTFCGRTFGRDELALMRQTAAEFSALGVTEIARTICELLQWKRPNGRLKNHECRQLLERLATQGSLRLPALRQRGGKGSRRPDVSRPCSEPALLEGAVSECQELELTLVEGPQTVAYMRSEVMKDQLGHADIQTTLGIYSHASRPETRGAEAALVEEYVLAGGAKSSRKTVVM